MKTATKHAPGILMGIGTTSSLLAVIDAAKATPAACEAKAEAERNKAIAQYGDNPIPEDAKVKLTIWEVICACWKFYGLAAALELLALISFWGAHGIGVRRQAILAGLCSSFEATIQEYQSKVREMIGDKAEKEIRKDIRQDYVSQNPPPQEFPVGKESDQWFLFNNQYFRSNYISVMDARNDANHEMIQNMYISRAEIMWLLDPDHKWLRVSDEDSNVVYDVDRLIEFDIQPIMGPKHESVFAITVTDKDGVEYHPKAGYRLM